jgi:hypothetical protein
MSDSFNERMRLIRFRRKRERTRFRDELRIIPRWLIRTCVALWLIALAIGVSVNVYNMQHNENYFPPDPEWLSHQVAACIALAGVITGAAIFVAAFLLMLGYVYKDAQRRGMHPVLWTLLVLGATLRRAKRKTAPRASIGEALAAFTASVGFLSLIVIFRFRSFKEVIRLGRAEREHDRLTSVGLDQPDGLLDAALLVRADREPEVPGLDLLRVVREHDAPARQRHALYTNENLHERILAFSGSKIGVAPATATVTG